MVSDPCNDKRWIIGVSGSSGMPYALRLIEVLSGLPSYDVHVVFSEAALRVLKEECGIKCSQATISTERLFGRATNNVTFYNPKDIGAWFASGSARFEGMVVAPCSMATLGMIAHGCGHNLIHRAADVCIKEHRQFILVPRETPLSSIHLENMLRLTNVGVRMVAAMPGFYHQPATIVDLVDMMVMKILDSMNIKVDLVKRWGEEDREIEKPKRAGGVVVSLNGDGY